MAVKIKIFIGILLIGALFIAGCFHGKKEITGVCFKNSQCESQGASQISEADSSNACCAASEQNAWCPKEGITETGGTIGGKLIECERTICQTCRKPIERPAQPQG